MYLFERGHFAMRYLRGDTWQTGRESGVGNLAGSESRERVMNAEESHRSPDHSPEPRSYPRLLTYLRKQFPFQRVASLMNCCLYTPTTCATTRSTVVVG